MSYCVNCGVELSPESKKCPLCDCPVVNPFDEGADHKPLYSDKIVLPKKTRKKYAAWLISFILAIPNIVCGLTNLFMPSTGHWSIYVMLSSLLVWVIVILPFMLKRRNPYVLLGVDTACVLLYLYSLFAINMKEGWFLHFALPLVLAFAAIVLFMLLWLQKKRKDEYIAIAVLVQISVYCIVIDILLHLFYTISSKVYFSFIVSASCLVLIGLLLLSVKNKRFGAWLSRKFFV